jgi:hypothetical protein
MTFSTLKHIKVFIDAKLTSKYPIMHVLNKPNTYCSTTQSGKDILGANYITTRIPHISLIHSVIEYGSRLCGSAAKRYIDKLYAMQYTRLHTVTGIYFCPYMGVLEIAHEIVPLTLRRKQLVFCRKNGF